MSNNAPDPYVVQGTGDTKKLLRNKLGATDQSTLSEKEHLLSANRIAEIRENPEMYSGAKPDQNMLQDIHKHIFKDVYHSEGEHPHPIAGAIRTTGIGKIGDPDYPIPFADTAANDLDSRLEYAFSALEKDGYLKGIGNKDTFVDKLSSHVSELWGVHSFREGNTRSMAVFTEQLALKAGYELAPIGKDFREALKTSVKDMNQDPLKRIIESKLLTETHQEKIPDNGKEASAFINKSIENAFANNMKPLVKIRKDLANTIKQLTTEITNARPGDDKIGMSKSLQAAQNALKHFDSTFLEKGREIRAQAAARTVAENPKTARIADTYNDKSKSQTKSKQASRV